VVGSGDGVGSRTGRRRGMEKGEVVCKCTEPMLTEGVGRGGEGVDGWGSGVEGWLVVVLATLARRRLLRRRGAGASARDGLVRRRGAGALMRDGLVWRRGAGPSMCDELVRRCEAGAPVRERSGGGGAGGDWGIWGFGFRDFEGKGAR
jgi:hypothetical protein